MKNQIKKLICLLFGHKMNYQLMYDMNVQECFHCKDVRAFYHDGTNFWTDAEYYGILGYPIWRLKNYIWSKYVWVKMKINKPKVNEWDDSLPF